MNRLPIAHHPRLVTVSFTPEQAQLIGAVEAELTSSAQEDEDGCSGYFPGFKDDSMALPQAAQLANAVPAVSLEGIALQHNFFRLSLKSQPSIFPYHIDSDSVTAVTGSLENLRGIAVVRGLINLSSKHHRELAYLDIDVESARQAGCLNERQGYIAYTGEVEGFEKTVSIPPREGMTAQGVLFWASQVLHGGRDGQAGHFVAGYGLEQAA